MLTEWSLQTVKKGNDEYMIVVSGVKDTGLCGGYWGNTEQLGRRRSRNPPETLQPGTEGRRGSVGSTGSADNKATPKGKKAVDTPQAKSNKKQVSGIALDLLCNLIVHRTMFKRVRTFID